MAVVQANPFPALAQEATARQLHVFFLADVPAAIDSVRLDALSRPSERWQCVAKAFYLDAPDGFGSSKLATQVERALGVSATARNWRTVMALAQMLAAVGGQP